MGRTGDLIERIQAQATALESSGLAGADKSDLVRLVEIETALEELRVAEEELRQQNDELLAVRSDLEAEKHRYFELFDQAPDAYLVTTLDGLIQEANRAAKRFLNSSAEGLERKPFAVFVEPVDRTAFRTWLNEAREGVPAREGEFRVRPHGGQPLPTAIRVTVACRPDGRPIGLRWMVRDVSGVRQAERLAALGQVSAGIAHEGRNALQRAQACLERLRWHLQGDSRALDLIGRCEAAQDDLCRLFDEVRDYAGPLGLEMGPCDVAEVCSEAWGELETARRGRDAVLDVQGADLARCDADAFWLRHVFRNVLDNALAACPDPVRIVVTCEDASECGEPALKARIRDNGPGFPTGQAEKAFDAFYTTKTRGTGLGLAIVRRIVQAHGGQVSAANASGGGAEITLTLPRSRP